MRLRNLQLFASAIAVLVLCCSPQSGRSAEPWQEALATMPLGTGPLTLTSTNCVGLTLRAFTSNHVVKALVFLPGATDEFYMFRRAKAQVSSTSPTLPDAVQALTNQTLIRPLSARHSCYCIRTRTT
jgi:hypothetical protein